jgi:hypothetical protein
MQQANTMYAMKSCDGHALVAQTPYEWYGGYKCMTVGTLHNNIILRRSIRVNVLTREVAMTKQIVACLHMIPMEQQIAWSSALTLSTNVVNAVNRRDNVTSCC